MMQLVLDDISKQLEKKMVTRSRRHDFTKGKSCLTYLVPTGWVEEGRAVDFAYLDFSKVCDSLHNTLIMKCGIGNVG